MRAPATLSCILILLAMSGCLPPYASVVVRDMPDPNTSFIRHHGDLYTRKNTYDLQSLTDRLASPAISHVKIHRVDGHVVEGRVIALHGIDGCEPIACLDATTTIPLSQVDRIAIYREIPRSERHQGFLVGPTLGVTVAVGVEAIGPGPWDWDNVALATAAGAALGSVFLLRHEELAEQVLFSYDSSR